MNNSPKVRRLRNNQLGTTYFWHRVIPLCISDPFCPINLFCMLFSTWTQETFIFVATPAEFRNIALLFPLTSLILSLPHTKHLSSCYTIAVTYAWATSLLFSFGHSNSFQTGRLLLPLPSISLSSTEQWHGGILINLRDHAISEPSNF